MSFLQGELNNLGRIPMKASESFEDLLSKLLIESEMEAEKNPPALNGLGLGSNHHSIVEGEKFLNFRSCHAMGTESWRAVTPPRSSTSPSSSSSSNSSSPLSTVSSSKFGAIGDGIMRPARATVEPSQSASVFDFEKDFKLFDGIPNVWSSGSDSSRDSFISGINDFDFRPELFNSSMSDAEVPLYPSPKHSQGDHYLLGFPFPAFSISTERPVNLADYFVRFRIHPLNFTPNIELRANRFEGQVISPSGQVIPCCTMRYEKETPDEIGYISGSFRSVDEVGSYLLRVRLVLPYPEGIWKFSGIVGDEQKILISRNYYKEAGNVKAMYEVEHARYTRENTNRSPRQEVGRAEDNFQAWDTVSKLWGLAADKQNKRLYYTDRISSSFSCIDAETGQAIFRYPAFVTAGPYLPSQGRLFRPTGIAFDAVNRRVIIADKDNFRIAIFSADGAFLFSFGGFGHANGEFCYPWGVAVSPSGNEIAVADSKNHRLQLFNKEGTFIGKFTIFEGNPFMYKNSFDFPRGITFSNDGTSIYVTDFNAHNLVEIPLDLSTYRIVLSKKYLNRPEGITVDEFDNVLLCDGRNKAVRHVCASKGYVVSQIHTIGDSKLEGPTNVAVLGDGKLAILNSDSKVYII